MAISRSFGALAALCLAGCASSGGLPNLAEEPLVLRSSDDQPVPLRALWRDRAATVLVFWSTTCPCVRRYQARVDQLQERYPAARVRVVGVSSNAGEDFAQVLATARERGVRIPLFRDEGGHVAEAVGAHSTPTVAVLDGRGQVRFLGWIDNERLPGDPQREPWLELALEGLLAERPFATRSPVYGCTITQSLFAPPSAPCCRSPH